MFNEKLPKRPILWEAYVSYDGVGYKDWRIYKRTPKGAWIFRNTISNKRIFPDTIPNKRKWVPYNTNFVGRTREEALENLLEKERMNVRHCKNILKEAKLQLIKANHQLDIVNKCSRCKLMCIA